MSTIYYRTAEFGKFYRSTVDVMVEEATRMSATGHPDVPGRSVGKYRRLLSDCLSTRAIYHYLAAADERSVVRGASALTAAAAAAMAAHVTANNRLAEYVTGTLGWSIERAGEIVRDRAREHEDRCREMVRTGSYRDLMDELAGV